MTDTPGTLEERLRHFSLFLRGEAANNGAWFGDNADGERGKFWWRKYLPLTEAADEIASLRARVSEFEKRLPFCETCGCDVSEILCAKCGGWWRDNDPEIHSLRARVEAVEQLLEGRDAFIVHWGLWDDFVDSTRQALKDSDNAE